MNQVEAASTGPVYVAYPQGLATGGPEALHQLVRELLDQQVEAYLTPMRGTHHAAPAPQFERYACPVVERPRDVPGARIVVPEIGLSELRSIRRATPYVWWLSIDNAPVFAEERLLSRSTRDAELFRHVAEKRAKRAVASALRRELSLRRQRALFGRTVHLTQSAYAWSYLYVRHGLSACMLSDRTQIEDFHPANWSRFAARGWSVAYNPAKGADLIAELQRRRPDIAWRPIQGMTRQQVVDLLNGTAVYLDLGHHPGKDRIPREAALAGAVTAVLRRGSGGFVDDVPIPEEHKISAVDPVEDALRVLDGLFADLPRAQAAQDHYRKVIAEEGTVFAREVRDVFVRDRREGGSRPPGAE